MKKLVFILLVLPFVMYAQSTNENHVVTKVYKTGTTTPITTQNKDQVSTSVQYFDELGRLKQTVAVNAGGNTISDNAIPIDWTVNATATNFFNRNGASTENKIVSGTTPFGGTDLLWECLPDAASGADGGWNTDFFTIDNTKTYRYTIWVKKNKVGGVPQGRTYHGTQSVDNLDGTPNNNPYFLYPLLPQANKWYLMVGIIHPHTYRGADTGVSGLYDTSGNKIADGLEYRWRSDNTTTRLRNYLYYCTDTTVRQYFWSPLFQEMDGGEIPLEDVITENSTVIAQENIKDIVSHVEYDNLGRMTKEYLPVTNGSGNANIRTENMATVTQDYYGRKYAEDFTSITSIADINAYSEKAYDYSPLNRVTEQAAPGTDWKLGNGHEIKFDYDVNVANEVKIYEVSTTFANNTYSPTLLGGTAFYSEGELSKTVTKDENWKDGQTHPKDHTTEEFKNKSGQVILKRTYNLNQPHDTYYVYDDFGNLTYVLPPKMEGTTSVLSTTINNLNDLGYQYVYDYRNRLVEKKIPGKGWEYIVYDKLDRPVLTQDAVQAAKTEKEWLFTKYDQLGRVAYTGIFSSNSSRESLQDTFSGKNNAESNYETKVSGYTLGGAYIYYSNNDFPTNIKEVLTIQYYDNYLVNRETSPIKVTSYEKTSELEVKGLPTVSKTKVLGTCCTLITNINYYDKKGRVFHSYSRNPYLGTTDVVESKLDDFTGKVLETRTTHTKTGKDPIITVDRFVYDHMDRLVSQNQQINNQVSERIVKNNYDDLGQLESKLLGNGTKTGYKDVTSGLSVVGNEMTKTGSTGWNTGLATQGTINGDGYVEFSPTHLYSKYYMVGLSSDNTNAHFNTIDYAIYIVHTSNVAIYEFGSSKGVKTTYELGDVFRVERIGNTIHYKKNGETFYISVTKSSGSLLGDLSIHSNGAKIKDFKIVDNSKGLQKVDYNYNVRGWLTNINDDVSNDNDLFNFSIQYNDPSVELSKRLYNGNIAQTSWQTQNVDNTRKTYNYAYDALNRITGATMPNTTNYNLGFVNIPITYDKNGNILRLFRYGPKNEEATVFGAMDNLHYTYDSGNKLVRMVDTGDKNFGFKDVAYSGNDYTYDVNGNMISDKNKRITNIKYNHLNLPVLVEFGPDSNGFGEGEIEYVYSALGEKLRKHTNIFEGDFPPYQDQETFTEYAGNYIYEGEYGSIDLQFFNHAEGYVQYNSSNEYEYVYQYRDIWRNTRITYSDINKDGVITTSTEILREQNYYPFGLEHRGYNTNIISVKNNLKQYQGQEFTEDLDLNTHEWRYRVSDPTIGRFWQIDPLSEKYTYNSTYAFQENKLGSGIELEGLENITWEQQQYVEITKGGQGLLSTLGSYVDKFFVSIGISSSEETGKKGSTTTVTNTNTTTISPNLEDFFINGFRPSSDGTAIVTDTPIIKVEESSKTTISKKVVDEEIKLRGPAKISTEVKVVTNVETGEFYVTGKIQMGVTSGDNKAGVFVSGESSTNGTVKVKTGVELSTKLDKSTISFTFGVTDTIGEDE